MTKLIKVVNLVNLLNLLNRKFLRKSNKLYNSHLLTLITSLYALSHYILLRIAFFLDYYTMYYLNYLQRVKLFIFCNLPIPSR